MGSLSKYAHMMSLPGLQKGWPGILLMIDAVYTCLLKIQFDSYDLSTGCRYCPPVDPYCKVRRQAQPLGIIGISLDLRVEPRVFGPGKCILYGDIYPACPE